MKTLIALLAAATLAGLVPRPATSPAEAPTAPGPAAVPPPAAPSSPDQELAPYPLVRSNRSGRSYVRMLPDPEAPFDRERGSIACFDVGTDGDTQRWSASGWYAYEVHLDADASHLVRIGNWPRGQAPSDEHLALAFYRDGELLARYSTRDLILDPSKVLPSVSHYGFRDGQHPPRFVQPGRFELTTVDRVQYTFDATTGKEIGRRQLPPE